MNRVIVIFIFLIIADTVKVSSQNYIGMHKDEIISLMSEKHRDFKLNKDVINRKFTYLKYEDKISEQTILYFLSDKGYCTLVRWMGDYANINDMLRMLNKKYTKTGRNRWTYTRNGKEYVINLEEGEWFFMVNFRQKIK